MLNIINNDNNNHKSTQRVQTSVKHVISTHIVIYTENN